MGAYKRGYRGAFWDSFGRGKCTPGRREEDRELELWFGWDGKKVIFAKIIVQNVYEYRI